MLRQTSTSVAVIRARAVSPTHSALTRQPATSVIARTALKAAPTHTAPVRYTLPLSLSLYTHTARYSLHNPNPTSVDMLSVDGDADAAVEARIRIGWNKFRQLVPLLTNKDVSLIMRGRLYSSCVRSSMLHGSETWPVRKENVVAFQRAEMRMVRWMCGVKLRS